VPTMTLQWGRDSKRRVSTVEELDAALDKIVDLSDAASLPYAVVISELKGERGNESSCLTIVVGPSRVPVSWSLPLREERISKGESDDTEPWLEFNWGGEYGDTEAWTLVPAEQAREAARRFFLTSGQCPDNLRWATSEERKRLFRASLPAVREKIPGLDDE
jgi:hypothetical protein